MRGSPTGRRSVVVVLGGVLAALVLAGCTSAPTDTADPAPAATSAAPTATSVSPGVGPAPSKTLTPSAAPDPKPDELVIDISIAGGRVEPNGKKLDVEVGQLITLNVTSDEDDEVHAHTSGDGYTLPVKAGSRVRGEFTLTSPGSYEVESHHLGKTIVILNAR